MPKPADEGDTVPVELLKMSEVRARTGIDVSTLRMLADDKLLPVARQRSGQAYMRREDVPTHQQLVELLETHVRALIKHGLEQLRRVEVEIEAARNDLELAAEDPRAELGHDLLTLRAHSNDPRAVPSALTSTLSRLELDTWSMRAYHDALTRALAIGPEHLD